MYNGKRSGIMKWAVPIVEEAPEYPAEAVEDVADDADLGVVVIVVDEGKPAPNKKQFFVCYLLKNFKTTDTDIVLRLGLEWTFHKIYTINGNVPYKAHRK